MASPRRWENFGLLPELEANVRMEEAVGRGRHRDLAEARSMCREADGELQFA